MCSRIFSAVLALSLCLAVAPLAAAEGAGGLSWTKPSGWTSKQRPMRAANYVVPPAGGDSEPGECAVYYFGSGQGGGVEANVQRWIGQFRAPDGGSADKLAKRSSKTVGGVRLTLVDLTGTYMFKPSPMAPKATPKPGYRMIAAIAEGPDAPIFFKLTAPEKTAASAEAAFQEMLDSIAKP